MRSWLAIGALLPIQVASLCLVNGTAPAERKNLVNPNGETYPVGIWVSNWAAGWATSHLVNTLIQEMLGYNTELKGPGGGTVHGYRAIAGCSRPTNDDDPGCETQVSYVHLTVEMWRGEASYGKVSQYFGKNQQAEAAQMQGLPLEFYSSYDVDCNSSRCIVYFTGGNGWGVDIIMQQAIAWNMPTAIAVAKDWSSFSALPLAVKSTFYWWVPDPTFLDLAPVEIIFPAYDRNAYAAGDFRTAPSELEITKGTSKDLFTLAPRVENFLVNMEIDMTTLNNILLEQKTTGDSWENVTCKWLQNNEATWSSWLPDDTTCFAGFGLVDIESGEFVMDRAIKEGKRCQACPSGTYSKQLVDTMGVTYICEQCPVGTSQASGASLTCDPCDKGSYQDELGSQSCKRCPLNNYNDQEGAAQCTVCPSGSGTLGLGSSIFTDCGCVEGRIDVSTTEGMLNCVECSTGLSCPAMSFLESYKTGTHPLGEKYVASVEAGYYTTALQPLEVYKCGKIFHCPGGLPETCAGGRDGVPCAECPQGETWSENQCMGCEVWRQVLWAVSIVGIFIFLTVSYYLMTSKVTAKASVLFTTTCAFGMLVSLLQSVGIIGMMTVEWPVDLKGFFSYFQVLLLDLDSFGFACFAGAETSFRYTVSVCFFPAAVAWLFLNFLVSKVLPPKWNWDWTKVSSCAGQVLQVGFSTITPM
eukprot:g24138.t1